MLAGIHSSPFTHMYVSLMLKKAMLSSCLTIVSTFTSSALFAVVDDSELNCNYYDDFNLVHVGQFKVLFQCFSIAQAQITSSLSLVIVSHDRGLSGYPGMSYVHLVTLLQNVLKCHQSVSVLIVINVRIIGMPSSYTVYPELIRKSANLCSHL